MAGNESGRLYICNPALERLTGLKSDQINQVDWRSFVLQEDRAAATASWQRSLATGTPYCTRVRMRGYDGVATTVELIAFGHKAGEGDGCETEIFSVDESWLSRASSSHHQALIPTLLKKPVLEEKESIEAALAETRGRVSGPTGAAAKLGIPSTTLESKIKSLKINKHVFKAS